MSGSPTVSFAAGTNVGLVKLATKEGIMETDTVHLKDVLSTADSVGGDEALDEELGDGTIRRKSTRDDAFHMRRMGKEQELVRHFRLWSMASFVAIATAAWEIGIFLLTPALVNGGRAGLVWTTISSILGFGPIYLSMAEMASMAPTAGAQYHWVSEFAPESCQRILSYMTGWSSTVAWQAGNALGVFLAGSVIQAAITVKNEDYVPHSWQGSLLAFLAIAIAYVGTVFGARVLPYWQNAVFVIHIFAFFAYVIPPWVAAPQATHHQVWLDFGSTGGWPTLGLSIMIGQLTSIGSQVGVDTAAHMAEEVKDASLAVPRAMLAVFGVNSLLLLLAVITVCYHVPSIEDALADTTTYPGVYVLRQSMSDQWVVIVLAVICFLMIASNVVYLAAVSRDLWAFARDYGLPFSSWISKVHPKRHIPENACILTSFISGLLALIYIGSPVAFYAITSLFTVTLLVCYSLSIGCVLWRRLALPDTLPQGKFSLGRYGVPINILAVLYSTYACFWSFWPQSYPITPGGFNWASPIFGLVLIVSGVYFVFWAKYRYVGPVSAVDGRKVHVG